LLAAFERQQRFRSAEERAAAAATVSLIRSDLGNVTGSAVLPPVEGLPSWLSHMPAFVAGCLSARQFKDLTSSALPTATTPSSRIQIVFVAQNDLHS